MHKSSYLQNVHDSYDKETCDLHLLINITGSLATSSRI